MCQYMTRGVFQFPATPLYLKLPEVTLPHLPWGWSGNTESMLHFHWGILSANYTLLRLNIIKTYIITWYHISPIRLSVILGIMSVSIFTTAIILYYTMNWAILNTVKPVNQTLNKLESCIYWNINKVPT